MYENKNIKKVCSFCVSDLHLVTMLLPYLDKKIKGNEKIIIITQRDLTEQAKLVLSRLTLNEESKNALLNINWKSKTEDELNSINTKIKNLNIIVNGTKEYIEKVNENLKQLTSINEMRDEIKIINCYDITKLDDDIKDILNIHDKILNTSGEKEISEVFEGYEKRKYA